MLSIGNIPFSRVLTALPVLPALCSGAVAILTFAQGDDQRVIAFVSAGTFNLVVFSLGISLPFVAVTATACAARWNYFYPRTAGEEYAAVCLYSGALFSLPVLYAPIVVRLCWAGFAAKYAVLTAVALEVAAVVFVMRKWEPGRPEALKVEVGDLTQPSAGAASGRRDPRQ